MAFLGFLSRIFKKKCFGAFEKGRAECADCRDSEKCRKATVKKNVEDVKREWGI